VSPTQAGIRLADPRAILEAAATVAVVGMSANPNKSAFAIPAGLQAAGFRVLPVNPRSKGVLGEQSYARLEDIPDPVDVVDVFRPAEEAPDIARSAVAIGAKALWLQKGIVSAQARSIAEAAGLDYIEDMCMGVERARYGITKHG
jgi:predicted CoA-binding protein